MTDYEAKDTFCRILAQLIKRLEEEAALTKPASALR